MFVTSILTACATFVATVEAIPTPLSPAEAAVDAVTAFLARNKHGAFFDRFAVIFLENTDFAMAAGDPNLKYLASQGITLTQYYGVTHPSEPNYIAAVGGDNFGDNSDDLNANPDYVFSVVDLLEDKSITWAEYQEDMPYSGFTGYEYTTSLTLNNDYVRKHNPLIQYDSVTNNAQRAANIKNFTLFYQDLASDKLPQYMFITPNMTNDGHDSSIITAGEWARSFLEPLMNNTNFMRRTLVLLTFDESETYTTKNNVFAMLLGDAIPKSLVGTTDDSFYMHYSQLATVEANWGLHHLGRWDVGANVFSCVAAKTGDVVRKWTGSVPFANAYFNQSYPGPLNVPNVAPYAMPNTSVVYAGRSILPAIANTNCPLCQPSYYTDTLEVPDGLRPPMESEALSTPVDGAEP